MVVNVCVWGRGGRWKAGSRTRRERPKIPEESLWRKTRKQTYKNSDVRRSSDTQQVYANTEQHHNQHMQYAPEINRGQMGGQGHSGSDTIGWKGSCDAAKTRGQRIRFAQRCKMQIRTKKICVQNFSTFLSKKFDENLTV